MEHMGRRIFIYLSVFNFVFSVIYKAKCKKSGECVALKKVLIKNEEEGLNELSTES
jgi:hypothetical protein